MISIVVTGRNDDYGEDFTERLLRASAHNAALLGAAGVDFEYLLIEWNPVPGRALLADPFTARVPASRALVVDPAVHRHHVRNPGMAFDEMAAKNVGLRRVRGDWALVTNADILFDPGLVQRIAGGGLREDTLHRAHRIDVAAATPGDRLADRRFHLATGEGTLPPCYYLGAGGDFCLASTGLWRRLRGFNQRVRFSTRAKDWQFFLSAAMQSVPIEFLGRVYHLEHAGGFGNTPSAVRHTSAAHFGGPWDIEFGLPALNGDDWGFPDLAATVREDGTIGELARAEGGSPTDEADVPWEEWLSRPDDEPDRLSAVLMHAACLAAGRRVPIVVRAECPADAVTAAGMAAVARAHGIRVCCDWDWSQVAPDGPPHLASAAAVEGLQHWVVERGRSGWVVRIGDRSALVDVEPRRRPIGRPRFNPMLSRRLLRVYLRLLADEVETLAIFGAGGHTRDLLEWGVPDALTVSSVVVSAGGAGECAGTPVRPIDAVDPGSVDAIVLSSIPHEGEMAARAAEAGFRRVVPLWCDWPPDFWTS